jgi:dTDP-4-amino-4,6-dideoxygalactose transaminase
VDVDEHGHFSVQAASQVLSERTRALIPVHYAGQSCDLDKILKFAKQHSLVVVEDAAHAAGTEFRGRKIGTHGQAAAFSFYVTKNITTGEGGMITTQDDGLAERLRLLSLHGISKDAWNRYGERGSWYYEVVEPGFKANMTDIQAALGIHQLKRLGEFIQRRRAIAGRYESTFAGVSELRLPADLPGRPHTFHLYPAQLALECLSIGRAEFIEQLRGANIGASVHFIPLHRHPFYRDTFGYRPEQFPIAERIYSGLVSLPLYPRMTDADVDYVAGKVREIVAAFRR